MSQIVSNKSGRWAEILPPPTYVEEESPYKPEQVLKFLDEVRATKIHPIQEESWGTHLSGGTDSLDTHLTKSADERVMRVSTINRSHKVLVGI